MAIAQRDFQKACLEFKLNWLGAGNDGLTVAQRLDRLQAALLELTDALASRPPPITEDRVKQLVAEAVRQLPPPPAGMTEARVKQLIAAAILDQHPLDEVATEEDLLLNEAGDWFLLETGSEDHLLTEAASPHRSSVVTWSDH